VAASKLNINSELFFSAVAISWLPEHTITVGQQFSLFDEAERDVTIVHELLHHYYNGYHADIARELFGLTGVTDEEARRAVETFLHSDCTRYR